MGRKVPQHRDVALGERVLLVGHQVESAQHFALVAQRHRQRRLHVLDNAHPARFGADIADKDRTLLGDGGSNHALANLEPEVFDHVFRISDRVRDAELTLGNVAPLVEQVDREHRERRQPRNQLRDLLQQFVEVEHRGDFAAEIEERREKLGVRIARRWGRFGREMLPGCRGQPRGGRCRRNPRSFFWV